MSEDETGASSGGDTSSGAMDSRFQRQVGRGVSQSKGDYEGREGTHSNYLTPNSGNSVITAISAVLQCALRSDCCTN